jgi:hypothetical protein
MKNISNPFHAKHEISRLDAVRIWSDLLLENII